MQEVVINQREKRIVELISPKKEDKILVIGTGVFPRIEYILNKKLGIKKIISGDIDFNNVQNAKAILPDLIFMQIDAEKPLPFPNGSFDKIVFTEVLEHINNEDVALTEIHRILKSNGKLIITVPRWRWYNFLSPITLFQHKREYTPNSIKQRLFENGFLIKSISFGGGFYEIVELWNHLIKKYLFKKIETNLSFKDKIDKYYTKDFKSKGRDILICAMKK